MAMYFQEARVRGSGRLFFDKGVYMRESLHHEMGHRTAHPLSHPGLRHHPVTPLPHATPAGSHPVHNHFHPSVYLVGAFIFLCMWMVFAKYDWIASKLWARAIVPNQSVESAMPMQVYKTSDHQ